MAANQFSGVNGILLYAKQLLMKVTGGESEDNQVYFIQLSISLLQVICTFATT